MSGIAMHPRYMVTAKAHNELDLAVIEIVKKYDLTYGELFNVLGQISCSWSRCMVKDERTENAK